MRGARYGVLSVLALLVLDQAAFAAGATGTGGNAFSQVPPWAIMKPSVRGVCFAMADAGPDHFNVAEPDPGVILLSLQNRTMKIIPGTSYPIGFRSGGMNIWPTMEVEVTALAIASDPPGLKISLSGSQRETLLNSGWMSFELGGKSHFINTGDLRAVSRSLKICTTNAVNPF